MLEGASLVELAKVLGGLAGPSVKRLSKERAGPTLGKAPSSLDTIFDGTLSRLTQGKLEATWWKGLRQRFRFEATRPPEFLRTASFQEWLQDETNREDVRALARDRVLEQEPDADAIQRLEGSLRQHTGETQEIAERIEIVVGLLVAGFKIAIPDESRAIVALQEETIRKVRELGGEGDRGHRDPTKTDAEGFLSDDSKDRAKTIPFARDVHRKKLVAELEALLGDHDLAIAALIQAATTERPNREPPAPTWSTIQRGSGAARALAEAICETEIGPVLFACNAAYHKLRGAAAETSDSETRRSHLSASGVVQQLASKVAPYLTAFRVGLDLPETHGGLFQLPCQLPTVFEMLLAVVEGREPQWRALSRAGEYPKGKGLMATPQFEVGALVGQELWAFARPLALSVFHPDDLPRAFRAEISPEGKELDGAMRRLNLQLEGRARRERGPFRYYLILDRVEGWDVDRLEKDLARHLPAIWLLRSDGGDDVEEAEWSISLGELLFAHQEASKRPTTGRDTP